MRKFSLSIVVTALCLVLTGGAFTQEAKKDTLTSEKLVEEGRQLDQQILNLCKKIEDTVAKYKLLGIKDIRLLPFQVSYSQGNDFLYMEKHFFVKDELVPSRVKIKKIKSAKVFTNGTTVNRLESLIREENYYDNTITEVKIVDPTPASPGTDDVVFTYIKNNKLIFTDKKLSEIKNTTAFPIQNQLKREFYVPHLVYFYDVLLNIAETYYKGIKDVDSIMTEFLKDSTKYY